MSSTSTLGSTSLKVLQNFGRSLMLPIAALPAAALLLRLGQADVLEALHIANSTTQMWGAVVSAAGGALFGNLPLLFAIGIAFGYAKKGDGSTALAGAVGYIVLKDVLTAMGPIVDPRTAEAIKEAGDAAYKVDYGVLAGIVAGVIAAILWQKFYRITLPDYLGFFGGRRFVPIIVSITMLFVGIILGFFYPYFDAGISALGNFVASNTVIGGGIFGVINRLLIPLGLHHIINSVVWFIQGNYTNSAGEVIHGDLHRFFAGDKTAGVFMTGFFPVMMFGLPAGALAIVQEAKPENRKAIAGIMTSTAFTAFLTGITEPIEFAFMFLAWPLYVVHALLTGLSLMITNALGIHSGFGFSAGFIDLAINWGISQKPLLLVGIGLIFAVVYYLVFRFMIRTFNLNTPGRGDEDVETPTV